MSADQGTTTTNARLWLYAIALPVLCLGLSWLQKPHLLDFAYIGSPPKSPSDGEHRLLSTDTTSIYFTNADLLRVRAGKMEPAMALFIDIYPRVDSRSTSASASRPALSNSHLAWTTLLLERIRGLTMDEASKADLRDQFAAKFRGPAALERGAVAVLSVDESAPLSRQLGIRAIIGLAVRDPGEDRLPEEMANLPTNVGAAIAKGFEEAGKLGIGTVAVPYMPVADRLGKPPPAGREAWHRLLEVVLEGVRGGAVKTVLIGAYAVREGNRERNHSDFVEAWRDFRAASLPKTPSMVHEPLRMATVALIGMLLGAYRQRWAMTARRLVIVVVASTIVAGSVAGAFVWLEPIIGDLVPAIVIVWGKLAVAFVAGFFARQLLSFDARRELLG